MLFEIRVALIISMLRINSIYWPKTEKNDLWNHPTFYIAQTQIDGLSIFYREAGPKDAPTILLLHGLPSSSRMFEPLFARLSDRYHLVAPDYPGFGHSDWPDPKKFAYTFDPHCRDYESLYRSARAQALHNALHAGLRRSRRFSHGTCAFRIASKLSLFRTPWRTTKVWERIGKTRTRVLERSCCE